MTQEQAPQAQAQAQAPQAADAYVKITPNESSSPAGKLADAELHFTAGPLAGMKLIGFSIWERRDKSGRNVTMPARQYSVNGERRSFALLRPIADMSADAAVRDLILAGYAKWEAENLPAPVEQAHTEDAYF